MWEDLKVLHRQNRDRHLIDLFAQDPDRAETYSIDGADLRLDLSKTQIDAPVLAALTALCDVSGLAARRAAMFSGEKINETEGRAVLHTALRRSDDSRVLVDGADVMPAVRETLDRMAAFAEAVRSGRLGGVGGSITDVVSIGIGGSDLGPVMATLALAPYSDGPRLHYVSNVDSAHIADTLKSLDPTRTLINVASKTFTTVETMTNARTARDWMVAGGGDPARQFSAISTALDLAAEFGIPADHVFGFSDWVGGRFSLWGPIGLPVMLAVGAGNFRAMLAGGEAMDRHFQTAPWARNLPVLLALVGLWHSHVCGYPSRAVLPYEQRLARLPAYLQQLEMESNGKSVAMDGSDVDGPTGAIVWGEPGTNGQHAFFQLLHQGTAVVPCEFIVGARGHEADLADHHRLLVANCLAQSQALMTGRGLEEARAKAAAAGFTGAELERQARHRVFPGNRPSVTLVYPQLTPAVLGQIVALYEHRVFAEGVILGINSFDQFGVELGKEIATSLGPLLAEGGSTAALDGSTAALIGYLREHGCCVV
ncbi:glucose-6-phosphate isomerase [Pseudodonghicola flavimaris]|uniref:Glucose-6-phosphate isomerase n=1 Tax=Pseudodonghicola flavimaris TaxID=3050036 RepID=A0ABT7F1J3_9RHOB|nr:glucose-6-phosphate isomerase [Pseudodonghicola flavimaris]MDK3018472.1 glucose-6-phosphate isomerase [Pseudodonghicola flavimaris]